MRILKRRSYETRWSGPIFDTFIAVILERVINIHFETINTNRLSRLTDTRPYSVDFFSWIMVSMIIKTMHIVLFKIDLSIIFGVEFVFVARPFQVVETDFRIYIIQTQVLVSDIDLCHIYKIESISFSVQR